jgi:hypothetical protein
VCAVGAERGYEGVAEDVGGVQEWVRRSISRKGGAAKGMRIESGKPAPVPSLPRTLVPLALPAHAQRRRRNRRRGRE